MTDGTQALVFIHGVGGALTRSAWLSPLSDAMAGLGHSRPERSDIAIVTVDYRAALLSAQEARLPEETWRKPKDDGLHLADYQARRAETARLVQHFKATAPSSGLGAMPLPSAAALGQLVETLLRNLREEARRYRSEEAARAAVLSRALADLRGHTRLVVVAHSLGSVVAADLVKRLPRAVVVDQLITIGSPLPLHRFWPFVDLAGDEFPFDRIRSWVNVFDSLDPVSVGRGIGGRCPEATDVDVHFGTLPRLVGNHAAEYYLSLPVVGSLVARALYGADATDWDGTGRDSRVPARTIAREWDLYLLSAAYALQVSATCDGKKHRWRRQFDAARRASVDKLLADADAHLDELPEAARVTPTAADFLDHATGLVRRAWTDEELLPLAVAMLMASPVRPYVIGIHPDHAIEALVSLFDRIRNEDSSLSDQNFAKAVGSALAEAKKAMGGVDTRWAILVLIGAGAGILAATGVGLALVAPAGLAGAALMTSTLAAFGPGGMVGGMMTIAAASSVGSALIGAGATKAGSEKVQASASFAVSLANLPKEELRVAVTGWIARLIAERELSFTSTVDQTQALLTAALVEVTNEANMHAGLGSKGVRAWKERGEVLDRALKWIGSNFASPAVDGVARALSRRDAPLAIDASKLRGLPSGADPEALRSATPIAES